MQKKFIGLLTVLIPVVVYASSSYEIRTNEEMVLLTSVATNKAGLEDAVEKVEHRYPGEYEVTYISGCVETYTPDRGSSEADGLKGMILLSRNCGNTNARFLCAAKIEAFVKATFPSDKESKSPIHSVLIRKSEARDATGDVDIEAYALFDEDGYTATRIFIGAEVIYNDKSEAVDCKEFKVKAFYPDALSE